MVFYWKELKIALFWSQGCFIIVIEMMEDGTILIQGVLDIEVQVLIDALRDVKLTEIAGYEFHEGVIGDKKVVVTKTASGVVNATTATVIGIMNFKPSAVINQGIAGAQREDLHVGDIVIGEKCREVNSYKTRFRMKGEGSNPFEWELTKRSRAVHYADASLVKAIEKGLVDRTKNQVYKGTLGSGDVHNKEYDRIVWINQTFGNMCEDMESIGVYTVCEKFGVPCVGVRIMANNNLLLEKLDREQAIRLQEALIEVLLVLCTTSNYC